MVMISLISFSLMAFFLALEVVYEYKVPEPKENAIYALKGCWVYAGLVAFITGFIAAWNWFPSLLSSV